MRAIRVHRFGGPEVLGLETVPDPVPGPGQVVVRVLAAGVNPVDTYIRSGTYGPREFPFTPGYDGAGIVAAVGPGVAGVTPGDRVYIARSITGTYAELVLCEAGQVRPLPERISFAQGAGVWVPYGTAYRAIVQRARAVAGEWALVHGASGGVGIACTQLARSLGIRVIGTAGSERGLELVLEQGADVALNHHDPGYLDEIRRLTGYPAGGVNLILEMLANVNLEKDLGLLAPGGRVVVIGSRGSIEITPRQTMARESAILGMTLNTVPPGELEPIHRAIAQGLGDGTLRPVVGRELALDEAANAHELVLRPGAYGKIVLLP